MVEADVDEFKSTVAKNLGDYTDMNGDDAVSAIGPYIIELYENVLSSRRNPNKQEQGAVCVSKKTETGYTVIGSLVYDDLNDAKDTYRRIIVHKNEEYIKQFASENPVLDVD